jgi:hypothetical protein
LCIFDINSSLNRFIVRLKKIVVISILICVFADIYAQNGVYKDTVYLKNNIKIPCKILETSFSEITIQFGDSSVTKINTDNIDHYQFADIKEFKRNKLVKNRQFSNNTVFFEGYGNGFYSSINYDRIIYRNNNFATSFRIGYSQFQHGCLLPMEFNFLEKGRINSCYCEFGIGYTPLVMTVDDFTQLYLRIGFRYQQPKGGIFFRIAFTPLYQISNTILNEWVYFSNDRTVYIDNFSSSGFKESIIIPWFGFSIGYTIQK